MKTNARYTRGYISGIVMTKAAFNKNTLFNSKLSLHLRKEQVKRHIWSIALYGAETWTLRKVNQKYLESFVIGEGWRRSVGHILWELKKYYTELRRRISYT
jgi:hypothetical protein